MKLNLQVSPEIYQKYDEMKASIERRKKESMFGVAVEKWDEVYPLIAAIDRAPKAAAGRTRKRNEELIVLPRFIVKYLIECTLSHVYAHDKEKQTEAKNNA